MCHTLRVELTNNVVSEPLNVFPINFEGVVARQVHDVVQNQLRRHDVAVGKLRRWVLSRKWQGPCRVTAKIAPGLLELEYGPKRFIVNANNLKPFR
jgi:hypothetical protein